MFIFEKFENNCGFVLKKELVNVKEVKSNLEHEKLRGKRPVLTPVFDHRELLKLPPKQPSWKPRKEEFQGYRATLETLRRKFRGEKPLVKETENVFQKLKMIEDRYQKAIREKNGVDSQNFYI